MSITATIGVAGISEVLTEPVVLGSQTLSNVELPTYVARDFVNRFHF